MCVTCWVAIRATYPPEVSSRRKPSRRGVSHRRFPSLSARLHHGEVQRHAGRAPRAGGWRSWGRGAGFSVRRSARLISAGRPCINMCQSAGEADVERGKRARGERHAALEGAQSLDVTDHPDRRVSVQAPPPRIVMGRWDGPLKGNIINQSWRPDIQRQTLQREDDRPGCLFSWSLLWTGACFISFQKKKKLKKKTIKTLFYSHCDLELLDDVTVQKSYERCVFHFTLHPCMGEDNRR